MRIFARASLIAPLALAALATACTHVAPYERGRLAQPTMDLAASDTATAEHVHAVHEGAAGGASPSSGGCGCN